LFSIAGKGEKGKAGKRKGGAGVRVAQGKHAIKTGGN